MSAENYGKACSSEPQSPSTELEVILSNYRYNNENLYTCVQGLATLSDKLVPLDPVKSIDNEDVAKAQEGILGGLEDAQSYHSSLISKLDALIQRLQQII